MFDALDSFEALGAIVGAALLCWWMAWAGRTVVEAFLGDDDV